MDPLQTIDQLSNLLQVIMMGLTTWVLTTVLKLRDRIQVIEIQVVQVILKQLERQDNEIKDLRKEVRELREEHHARLAD
jgi:cell shape-determining protein MreC